MPAGRPSSYTPEIITEIAQRLAEGEPLAEICRSQGMPNPSTVWRWAQNDAVIAQVIAGAREDGEERITADIRKVARGIKGYTTGDVQRDKLVVDTDLKLLAKWNPKKYGERSETRLTSEEGGFHVVLRSVLDKKPGN